MEGQVSCSVYIRIRPVWLLGPFVIGGCFVIGLRFLGVSNDSIDVRGLVLVRYRTWSCAHDGKVSEAPATAPPAQDLGHALPPPLAAPGA